MEKETHSRRSFLNKLWLVLGGDERARESAERAREICGDLEARHPEAYALQHLAALADRAGDVVGAMKLYQEALGLRRDIGHGDGIADSLNEITVLSNTMSIVADPSVLFAARLVLTITSTVCWAGPG